MIGLLCKFESTLLNLEFAVVERQLHVFLTVGSPLVHLWCKSDLPLAHLWFTLAALLFSPLAHFWLSFDLLFAFVASAGIEGKKNFVADLKMLL